MTRDVNRQLEQDIFAKAARLANNGKFFEAGEYLMGILKTPPQAVGKLNAHGKKIAYLAATYFSKSPDVQPAVSLYTALGECGKAASVLEKSGDLLGAQRLRERRFVQRESLSGNKAAAVGGTVVSSYTANRFEKEGKIDLAIQAYVQLHQYEDAARLYLQQGRVGEAANMYAEAGNPFGAAQAYLQAGDTGKGFDNLILIPRDHPQYRNAALKAVQLASEHSRMSFELDSFLSEFIRNAPINDRECEALYLLSVLYEKQNMLVNAKEVLGKILASNPDFKDVRAKLEKVERFSVPATVYEKIRAEEESFYRDKARMNPAAMLKEIASRKLPSLPPMPSLSTVDVNLEPIKTKVGKATDAVQAAKVVSSASQAPPPSVESTSPVTAAAIEEEFSDGNMIAQRYLIKKQIGRGGMAAVYKAEDQELDEEIALKLFLTQLDTGSALEESKQRFKEELKLSRRLSHRNIINLYDIGIHKGHQYISMELLNGTDLDQVIHKPQNGILPFKMGLHYMIQACAGLHAAHEMNLVHRDVKPENLFVTKEGIVKVMDFGIAKNTVKKGMTVKGMIAGTPHYMAPEQISDFSSVTPRTDMYAVGIILYRMFCGQLPYDHKDLTKLLIMHINESPRRPRQFNTDIPPALEAVILKLMEKNPKDRFNDARETAAALKQIYRSL